MAFQEKVDIEKLRYNFALLEAEPRQEESRAQSLAAAIALIMFGFILWTVLGFACVRRLASAYNFQESTCFIEEREDFVSNKTCNCIEAPECVSLYPCVRLNAIFQTESDAVEVLRGVLYDTIYDVNSECSFAPPCSKNKDNNVQAVHSFITSYHGNTNVSCYYNPNDFNQIILRPNSHAMDLFHALFWPFLCVLVGFVMFHRYCRKKKTGST